MVKHHLCLSVCVPYALAAECHDAGADGRTEILRPRAARARSRAGARHARQHQPGGSAVAQRVVLYEEDPNDPQGKQYVGSAVWRTETVSPGTGLAPELQVRADIEIPERHITATWTLRRNTDKALPASHTIEIMFNLPPD